MASPTFEFDDYRRKAMSAPRRAALTPAQMSHLSGSTCDTWISSKLRPQMFAALRAGDRVRLTLNNCEC